jgi:hypothetical protein
MKRALMSSTRPAASVEDVPDNFYPELSDADRRDLWTAVAPVVASVVARASPVDQLKAMTEHTSAGIQRLMKERPDLVRRVRAILARRESFGIPPGSVVRKR